jgi:hypothetical protein
VGSFARRFVALGLLSTLVALTSAEEPDGTIIRMTAVVTNARGDALPGLRATDFQITVDGAPRPVEAVEFRSARTPAPRIVALLLDEFHVDAAISAAVRDRLLSVLDTQFRPGDLVVVFKPLDSLTSIEPTSDL